MPLPYSRGSTLVRLIILSFKYSSSKVGLASSLVRILAIISIIGIYLSLISIVLIWSLIK
jgi:hypothetical protein